MDSLFRRRDYERADPLQVFTPSKPVREDMFASRHFENLQENFELAVREPGRQISQVPGRGVRAPRSSRR